MTSATTAYKDGNGVNTIIAASNADGKTPVRIYANPSTHSLMIDDNTTGSNAGNNNGNAARDTNFVPVWIAVSSVTATVDGVNYVEGVTPVEVYGDPATGSILINSN
jgi:hypothetical protein